MESASQVVKLPMQQKAMQFISKNKYGLIGVLLFIDIFNIPYESRSC